MPPAFTLSQAERLKKKEEFSDIYNTGKRYSTPWLTIYFKKAPGTSPGVSKFGIVASRKVGSAPQRNYLKRVLREAYRQNKHRLKSPALIVIVLKPAAREITGAMLQPAFIELCQKAHLI
jgi:ribonuclease P protein component